MIGAVAGDIIGSVFEGGASTDEDFELFNIYANITDDTVCTVAISEWLQYAVSAPDKVLNVDHFLRKWVKAYPGRGYGGRFYDWVHNLRVNPPNSLANGAVMRISAIGHLSKTLDECLDLAQKSCIPTHNHPDAIEAAKFVAGAIFLYKNDYSADEVRSWVESNSNYEFFDNIRDFLKFSDSYNQKARETAIVALNISFLAKNFEDGMRKLCFLGGDTDTTCATAGGILEAQFGMPVALARETKKYLTHDMCEVLEGQYQCLDETVPWDLQENTQESVQPCDTTLTKSNISIIDKIMRFFGK